MNYCTKSCTNHIVTRFAGPARPAESSARFCAEIMEVRDTSYRRCTSKYHVSHHSFSSNVPHIFTHSKDSGGERVADVTVWCPLIINTRHLTKNGSHAHDKKEASFGSSVMTSRPCLGQSISDTWMDQEHAELCLASCKAMPACPPTNAAGADHSWYSRELGQLRITTERRALKGVERNSF